MTAAPIPPGSGFGLENLPLGVFDPGDGARLGTAIGDQVVDLRAAAAAGLLPQEEALAEPDLRGFLSLGRAAWSEVREALRLLLSTRYDRVPDGALRPQRAVRMLLPVVPGDYVDFYSSLHHASNLGRLFRPGTEPLHPNWRHLPIGYHGRAGSVVVSGTPVHRPSGPVGPGSGAVPTAALDFELEVGFITGPGNRRGVPIAADAVADHVFGVVLVDDWSARDIQRWEYTPLGPFLGKSFATTVSPWVVPLAALEPYRVPGPVQDPPPAPYLTTTGDWGLDIALEVELRSAAGISMVVTRAGFADMYWTIAQQLAHLTINGAVVRPGDLFASGTVSGEAPGSWGSLVEATANGAEPLVFPDGATRGFLEDGDTVVIRGSCRREGLPSIDFGECTGTVVAAVSL